MRGEDIYVKEKWARAIDAWWHEKWINFPFAVSRTHNNNNKFCASESKNQIEWDKVSDGISGEFIAK